MCMQWLPVSLLPRESLGTRLAPLRTSKHIRTYENGAVLHVPATGLTCYTSLHFQLFSYPVHFGSHFIFGHESHSQLIIMPCVPGINVNLGP